MLKCSVIGAELLEVSLVKLAPPVRSRPNQALRPPLRALSYSHTSMLACSSWAGAARCGRRAPSCRQEASSGA